MKRTRTALLFALVLASLACGETFLEVGDGTRDECRFRVSDDAPVVLTADTIRYCAGWFNFEVVESPVVIVGAN